MKYSINNEQSQELRLRKDQDEDLEKITFEIDGQDRKYHMKSDSGKIYDSQNNYIG
jgi:hypothetical protein